MAKKKPPATTEAVPTATGEYTVVARRYRPQQFSDLVGQEPVVRALTNAIQSGRVAHAYLFTGARGVGKTSAARILAKALNCVKGPTVKPCDECDICKAITAGQDLDVSEIDGASHTSVDDARTIRANVATRPQRARYKIYLIDEVHMLSKSAFNALLKTLEEPPPHVKFIFATTEVNKIPITILSRCQRFDFGGINTTRILEQLKEIVAREGIEADEAALKLVARRAGGSMRDSQSLLEQLLSAGEKLTTDVVHALLGTAADDRVIAIASAALAGDVSQALSLVARSADEGLQLGELIDQLIEYWRGLMLVNSSPAMAEELNVTDDHRETVKRQAVGLSLDTILAGLDVLTTAKSRLRMTTQPQVIVEMSVVRLARLGELIPISQLAATLSQPGAAVSLGGAKPGATAVPTAEAAKKNGPLNPTSLAKPISNGSASSAATAAQVTPISDANLSEVWNSVLQEAGFMLASELNKAGLPAIAGPKALALRFASGYNHAYEFCKEPIRATQVETLLRRRTGQEWGLRFELDSTQVAAQPVPQVSNRERERKALESPLLSRIVSQLDGRLLKMDPGFGESDPPAAEAVA